MTIQRIEQRDQHILKQYKLHEYLHLKQWEKTFFFFACG